MAWQTCVGCGKRRNCREVEWGVAQVLARVRTPWANARPVPLCRACRERIEQQPPRWTEQGELYRVEEVRHSADQVVQRVVDNALDVLALDYGLSCHAAERPSLARSQHASVTYGVGGEREWEWTEKKRGYGRGYNHGGAWYDARSNEVVLHNHLGREVQRVPAIAVILPLCRVWRWPGVGEFFSPGQLLGDATTTLVYADWLGDHGHHACEQWVRRWVRETTEVASDSSGEPPPPPRRGR